MVFQIQSVLDVWNYDRNALEADADVLETIQRAFESGVLCWFSC